KLCGYVRKGVDAPRGNVPPSFLDRFALLRRLRLVIERSIPQGLEHRVLPLERSDAAGAGHGESIDVRTFGRNQGRFPLGFGPLAWVSLAQAGPSGAPSGV